MLARENRSYQQPRTTQRGFTIVELLVVIVIIGVLAAITIVAYNGITKRARQAALQSDLSNGAKVLGLANAADGTFPANAGDANNGQGLRASQGDTLTYNPSSDGTTYCLAATGYDMSYFVTSSNTTPQTGTCSSSTGVPGDGIAGAGHVNGGYVLTLAGNGTAGYIDGTGTTAEFDSPYSVAIDLAGNVYVVDGDNNRVRKITPAGVVTTLAGNGSYGYVNGTGTLAEFNGLGGVAVDTSGTVYVADSGNNRIRKITPAGVVSTLAGNDTAGYIDGTGAAAEFDNPFGIAVDSSGNVYVGDTGNYRVRKISPSGVVTTLAGSGTYGYADGTGTAAQFKNPSSLAVDASSVLYVADYNDNRIRKITPSGVVTTLAGSGTYGYADGTGTAAQFKNPSGVAVDASGTLYVADMYDYHIRKITPGGVVTTLAGNGTAGYADGTGTAAKFNYPEGVAVDTSGNIYIADYGNNRIRVIK